MTLPTLAYLAFPKQVAKRDKFPANFDLVDWSVTEFRWEQDSWGGLRDVAAPPQSTIESATGDCDDYARVVSGYLHSHTERPVAVHALVGDRSLPFLPVSFPALRHVVVTDDEYVYSSGRVYSEGLDSYLSETGYRRGFSRELRS